MHNRAGKRETHFDIPGTLCMIFFAVYFWKWTFKCQKVPKFLNSWANKIDDSPRKLTTVHGS